MSRLTFAIVAIVLATTSLALSDHPADRDDCDYTRAVNSCSNLIEHSTCKFYKCIHDKCRTTWAHETAVEHCLEKPNNAPLALLSLPSKKIHDGHNSDVKERRAPLGGDKPVIRADMTAEESKKLLATIPAVDSPCFHVHAKWSRAKIQHHLFKVSMDVYKDRADEHYTEGSQRWSGIDGNVCPPKAPTYSDCSSTVTWIYWTLFGKGGDFLNGEQWKAGYTGTLIQHGTQVDVSSLQIGDLCFYYHPMHHVAIYVGNGKVVSHGADPVGYYDLNYAPLDYCRRYI